VIDWAIMEIQKKAQVPTTLAESAYVHQTNHRTSGSHIQCVTDLEFLSGSQVPFDAARNGGSSRFAVTNNAGQISVIFGNGANVIDNTDEADLMLRQVEIAHIENDQRDSDWLT
jgi:hypothetical protein